MGKYGIILSKTGYDIDDPDIRNILMSSEFSMLKYHSSDNYGSATFNAGDSDKYIDFTHNLGYVPAHISYIDYEGKIYNINWAKASDVGGLFYSYSWGDTTKIRCGMFFSPPYGWHRHPGIGGIGFCDSFSNYYDINGYLLVGQRYGGSRDSALRFDGIGLNKDAPISSATLTIIFNSHSTTDTDLKMITYGIDEDDTHDFDSGESNPLSRTKTSASTTSQFNDKNTRVDIDVKSIVEEITTRSGWSSGNAIGFTMLNNGSPTDVWFDCYPSTISTMYLIIVGGESFDIYFKCIIFKDKIA